MTPFRQLLMAAPKSREYVQRKGDAWDVDMASGDIYCWSCGIRGLAGRVCEDYGIKPTRAKKYIGENPVCCWCGQTEFLARKKPKSRISRKNKRLMRESWKFLVQLAGACRR